MKMTTSGAAVGALGAAAMGWGGSALDSRLGLSGSHSADLAIFAIGVVFLGQLPAVVLGARVKRLEAELSALRGDSGADAS
jgi:hypothetical protein